MAGDGDTGQIARQHAGRNARRHQVGARSADHRLRLSNTGCRSTALRPGCPVSLRGSQLDDLCRMSSERDLDDNEEDHHEHGDHDDRLDHR